jgi:uncharacterized membrane protein YdjX (TVP38/TMEM64 family)
MSRSKVEQLLSALGEILGYFSVAVAGYVIGKQTHWTPLAVYLMLLLAAWGQWDWRTRPAKDDLTIKSRLYRRYVLVTTVGRVIGPLWVVWIVLGSGSRTARTLSYIAVLVVIQWTRRLQKQVTRPIA